MTDPAGTPRTARLVRLLPLTFLALFFFWPVAHAATFLHPGTLLDTLTRADTLRVAWFTLWQAAASTAVTLVVGLPLTWATSRYTFRGANLLRGLASAPFLMPAVVVATGIAAALPERGIPAILWAHTCFNVAVVLTAVGPRWAMTDPDMEDAAASLGANAFTTFTRITWPSIRSAVITTASLVFAFCFSSFAVISILGGAHLRTLETEVFTQAVRLGDIPTATALALLQTVVVVTVIAFGRTRGTEPTRTNPSPRRLTSRFRRPWLPPAIAAAATTFTAAPLALVAVRSVRSGGTFTLSGWRALVDGSLEPVGIHTGAVITHSVTFAAVTAVIATALALLAARRTPTLAERLSFAPLVISAVTLGLGLIITFDDAPTDWRSRTWLLPVVHAVVALPLAVRTIATALRGIDDDLYVMAADLGATPLRTWWSVELPLLRPAITRAAGISAAVSLGEFGATSFLSRSGSMTVPIAIGQLMGRPGALLQQAAFALATLIAMGTAVAITSIVSD